MKSKDINDISKETIIIKGIASIIMQMKNPNIKDIYKLIAPFGFTLTKKLTLEDIERITKEVEESA